MASVIGTILFVIVLVAAIGAQEYMSSLQEQSSQGAQQAQQLLNQKGAESLMYSMPAAGLTVTNKGGVSSDVKEVVLKFANGTVYTFPEDLSLPSGASVLAQSLIPNGSCGGAACVQKYDSIVSGAAPGSLVGFVTSLGNTFWNPCVSSASSDTYVEDDSPVPASPSLQGSSSGTSASEADPDTATATSCYSSASLEPSLAGQWNENAPFPSSKCGNALYCAYNAGYDFCVTDSYPESSAVFGQVVAGRISTWEGTNSSACAYAEPFCRPGTNGEVVDCTSYSGYMYCVDQTGVWTSSPLTTGGFGNWTILGDANNAFDSVAESCGVVGSLMACLTELGWEYTFPLNSTGGTGMPSECVLPYGGYDWFHNPACDSIWVRGNGGGSSACVGVSAGLECQAGIGGSYPDTYWLNDTLLYPVNSTGFMLNATVVGPAFGASIVPHDAELGFYQGESCVFVSALYCLGGYGYNSTSGSPYPPFDTFGNLTLSGWDYLSQYPFGVYSSGARVDEICCSWSPSAGANLVTDGSTFVLSVGGVVNASYAYPSTNESYSYIFSVPTTSCPSGHCTSGSTTYECGAPPSSSTTTTTTILNPEGNWTSYVPVWVLNSTVPWSYVYNVFVSTSGLVIVQAGADGLYRVGLSGAITQLSSGWSYPPDTIPISDSSAYGTYVITEVTWSSPPEILVIKNGSLLQTLTVAEGISGYTVMDISADGQFIVFVGNPYIELFQGQGRT